MSRWPGLASVRLGCVRYLNAAPLIHGYDGPVVFGDPATLARDIAGGDLDAALVPIFEALGPRHYLLVDGVGITSDGPVFSVFLAHRGPLRDVRRITIDRASVTSVNLLRVILAEFHQLRPELVAPEETVEPADALLLIGNQAIEFRHTHGETHQFFDLGEEWRRETGLPFVYAAWVLLPSLPNASSVAEEFRSLKRDGVARLAEIVENGEIGSREFRRRYLTEHIRFDLGIREKAGLEKFRSLLVKHGLAPAGSAPLEYV